jgi:ribonuclease HII
VGDSKKIQVRNREVITTQAKELHRQGAIRVVIATVSARVIDQIGIVPAINRAIQRGLTRCMRGTADQPQLLPQQCLVKLDGGLEAPKEFCQQETIVRGDAAEPIIGLASIVAKVQRDAHMCRLGTQSQYKEYGFAEHKGYGTVKHREAILQFGLSDEHRRTFTRRYHSEGDRR